VDLCSGLVQKNYQVTDVTGLDLPTERRLEALGLIKGTKICVLNKKKHGAIVIKVRGTRFALGQNIARGIQIEEVAL